ncbi:MAG TPA: hypothetical protein VGE74_33120 [Gemmata sp.]
MLRRRVILANVFVFALAWLIVIGLNPTDPFTTGCQLSFLSVSVMAPPGAVPPEAESAGI